MGKYDDIINTKWPVASSRKRMSMEDRAKIFLPFAALKGFEEVIASRQKIVVEKSELTEDAKEDLDYRILKIKALLDNKVQPIITVIHFVKEPGIKEGQYIKTTGVVTKLNWESKWITIVNKKINLEEVFAIEGEIF